jgi:hypothetical protein
VTDEKASAITTDELARLLPLLDGADSVELKLSVPDANQRSAVHALDVDPLDAQLRQVVFFDTPDLTLDRHGVVVRARRVQRKPGDSVIKLRPLSPEHVSAETRMSPAFGIEVDAMPGGFVCSGSMKARLDDAAVKDAMAGRLPVKRLFTKEQRQLFAARAPEGIALDDLAVLGPINVLKLKSTPAGYERPLVLELWFYPDGSRILELSTKCLPHEAFEVAARSRVFLQERGIEVLAEQHTKTRTALDFFAGELTSTQPAG